MSAIKSSYVFIDSFKKRPSAIQVFSDFELYTSGHLCWNEWDSLGIAPADSKQLHIRIYHHVSGSMAGGHAVRMAPLKATSSTFALVLVRGSVALVGFISPKQVGWGVDGGVKYWKVLSSKRHGAWMTVKVMFKPIHVKSSCPDCLLPARA